MNEKPSKIEADVNALTVRKIGNSVGIILPKDLLARLNLQEGDKLYPGEGPNRELKLSPYDETHAKGMEIARRAFRTYANTFKALAE